MKTWSVILLAAVILSVITPLCPVGPDMTADGNPSMASLDVCAASGVTLLSSPDATSVTEAVCSPMRPGGTGYHAAAHPGIPSLLLSFEEDRPPKA
jgi:hypothetical protein